jgi:hypothetical protein
MVSIVIVVTVLLFHTVQYYSDHVGLLEPKLIKHGPRYMTNGIALSNNEHDAIHSRRKNLSVYDKQWRTVQNHKINILLDIRQELCQPV